MSLELAKETVSAVITFDEDSVAQLVEQLTLNQWVESSSLSGVTKTSRTEINVLLFLCVNVCTFNEKCVLL